MSLFCNVPIFLLIVIVLYDVSLNISNSYISYIKYKGKACKQFAVYSAT